MIYSIVPPEIIFENKKDKENYKIKEVQYQGEKLQVMQLENNRLKVQRIISTNPQAYMNPNIQPGTIIKLGFVDDDSPEGA